MSQDSSSQEEVLDILRPIDTQRQSIPINKQDEVNGQIRRHIDFVDGWLLRRNPGVTTLYENWKHGVTNYPDNECFGVKYYGDSEFTFITYSEADKLASRIASGLYRLNFREGDHVGIYAKNNPRWVITSEACNYQKYVSVALYDTLGHENLEYVVNHAELSVVFGTVDTLLNLLTVVEELEYLEYVIPLYSSEELEGLISPEAYEKMVEDENRLLELVGEREVTLIPFMELVKKGKKYSREPNTPEPDDLAIIMYTSGTTGPPKGVMMSHKNVLSTVDSGYLQLKGLHAPQDSYLSYLPLAHILERVNMAAMLQNGIKVGFYSGDIRQLSDDIASFKPSILGGVPRIFDRIHEGINAKVEASAIGKIIFKSAYKDRTKAKSKGKKSKSIFDSLAFKKAKKALGGKVRIIVSGGAPLSAATQQFISTVFDCPVLQGYGLTETCAGCCISSPDDDTPGQVGPPIPSCEVKLVSVPDMNYFVHKKPSCGEVWIRGHNVTQGYYKQPEKTAEDFTEDGWFKTGDIGTWNENGTLSIIDRKKNIFKLAQGEYVAAELLENIYNRGRHTAQFWIYGNSEESTLIAFASVNPLTIGELCPEGVDSSDIESICQHPDVVAQVLSDINDIATENNRAGFERIKKLYLCPFEWTTENNLATPTLKLKRLQLREYFHDEIERMYAEIHGEGKKKKKGSRHVNEKKTRKSGDHDDEKPPRKKSRKSIDLDEEKPRKKSSRHRKSSVDHGDEEDVKHKKRRKRSVEPSDDESSDDE